MARKLISHSWIGYFASMLLVFLVGAGAFYFFYADKQGERQSQYLLRLLGTAGQSVGETMVGLRGNVQKAAGVSVDTLRAENGNYSKELEDKIKKKLALIPHLDTENSFKWTKKKILTTKLNDFSVEVSVTVGEGGYVLSFLVGKAIGEDAEDVADSKRTPYFKVNAKLADMLAPALPADVFAGGVFLAGRNETVLLQKGGGTVQLMRLPKEKPSKEGKGSTANDIPGTTEIRDIEIAGKKYKMFVQPFPLPLDIRWGLSNAGSDSVLRVENNWVVAGLIPTSSFRADTMAVPFAFVAAVLFLLIIGFLCLPFLRIRFIGLREGLKAHDVVVLAVAVMVGTSLVAFAVIHLLTFRAERKVEREHLEKVAADISASVKSELDSLECELVRQAMSLELRLGKSTADSIRTDILATDGHAYPHFEMVFGVNAKGLQRWKWSIRKTTTPVSSFPDRPYFKRARDYDLELRPAAAFGPCKERSGFLNGRVIQSIRSKTTSEVYLMLSLRRLGEDAQHCIVSGIEAQLLSLIDPVLPPGYGFAVIDRSGTVQFHSERDRNLREDFFEETDWDEDVTGAVLTGVENHVNITYRAEPRRAFVTSLEGTPWTLVVFVDRRLLGHLDLETLIFSLTMYGLYFLVFLLACALVHRLCGSRPAPGEACRMWFWPNRNAEARYRRMLVYVGIFIVGWCLGSVLFDSLMPYFCIAYPPILIALLRRSLGHPVADSGSSGGTGAATASRVPEAGSKGGMSRSTRWQWTYAVLVVAVLFSVSILPPFTFYKAVHREEVTVFAKQCQLALAQSLRDRVDRHVSYFRDVKLSDDNRRSIRESLYLSDNGNSNVQNAPDIHVAGADIWESAGSIDPPDAPVISKQMIIALLRGLAVLPTYDETSSVTRGLSYPGRPDKYRQAWFIERDPVPRPRLEATDSLRRAWFPESDSEAPRLEMTIPDFRSSIPLGRNHAPVDSLHLCSVSIRTPLDYLQSVSLVQILIAALFAFVVLLWITRTIMRVVFLSDMMYPLSIKGEDLVDDPVFDKQMRIRLRKHDPGEVGGESPYVIDFLDIKKAESSDVLLADVAQSSKAEVLLTKFDYGLQDPEIAAKKLDLLEGLAAMEGTRVVVESSIDPLYFLTAAAHDSWKAGGKEQVPLGRWSAVLQAFEKIRSGATEDEFPRRRGEFEEEMKGVEKFGDLPDDVRESLVSEGWPKLYLRGYARALASRPELMEYTADAVVDQVQDMAAARYRRLWAACSTDEKVLLYRLAQEGFVNWRMEDTLRSLIRRGIVIAAPEFRLMNESFRRFILRAERPEVFQKWEKDVGASLWSKVRAPLVLFGVLLAAFFFATQRDVFNQSLGMLAALTAGAPVLIKIVGALTQSRDSSSTQG